MLASGVLNEFCVILNLKFLPICTLAHVVFFLYSFYILPFKLFFSIQVFHLLSLPPLASIINQKHNSNNVSILLKK